MRSASQNVVFIIWLDILLPLCFKSKLFVDYKDDISQNLRFFCILHGGHLDLCHEESSKTLKKARQKWVSQEKNGIRPT